MKRTFAACLGLWFGCSQLIAWGGEGHQAIGIAAQKYLQGTTAANQLKSLLGPDWTIAQAATWPDDLKQLLKHEGPLLATHTAESNAFNHAFPQSHNWHFVDMPLLGAGYDHNAFYASKDDILHAIAMCLNVLNPARFPLGQFADSKLDPALTRPQALRFLVHLTGDLHQPLHVGSGYYSVPKGKAVNPISKAEDAGSAGILDDHGANALFYTKSEEFHAYWDTVLPKSIAKDVPTLAGAIGPQSGQKLDCPSGKPAEWPAVWANSSLKEAKHAYDGITFSSTPPVLTTLDGATELKDVPISGPGADYAGAFGSDVKSQLTLGATHLACLLQAVLTN